MKYLGILFLLIFVSIASAGPLHGNFDKEINTFIQRIPESVVSIKVTNYNRTIMVVATGLSGNIYALGIGDKDNTSEDDDSGSSYSYYHSGGRGDDAPLTVMDQLRQTLKKKTIKDVAEFNGFTEELIQEYPDVSAGKRVIDNAEMAALDLLSAAEGPDMYDDMLRILKLELEVNPKSVIDGDVQAISKYLVDHQPDKLIEFVDFLHQVRPKGDIIDQMSRKSFRLYMEQLRDSKKDKD